MLQALQPRFGGVGEAFVRHRQEHCCPRGGTQLLRGLIPTRHFIWRNPVSPRGQEYALDKVFIPFNRERTFPHAQKSLLTCPCHLSPSRSQPEPPFPLRGQSWTDRPTHTCSWGSGTSCASPAHPGRAEGQWVDSAAPYIWHRDPTYTPCSEPRGEAAQRHPPPSFSLTLWEHFSPAPGRFAASEGQGLWVTGEVRAAAHLQHRVRVTQSDSGSQPCHPAR